MTRHSRVLQVRIRPGAATDAFRQDLDQILNEGGVYVGGTIPECESGLAVHAFGASGLDWLWLTAQGSSGTTLLTHQTVLHQIAYEIGAPLPTIPDDPQTALWHPRPALRADVSRLVFRSWPLG